MRKFWITLCSVALFLFGSMIPAALASIFPDVPEGHIYREPVEVLVGAQVIDGNPDGNFYPERAVNRAEMLKMLYRAKGKMPDPTSKGCFPDVEEGSWYEAYVCDAAAQRYVQGYADGLFRPADLVNRVEAIKMIAEVFGMDIEEITDASREIVKFVDVSTAAWYTKYLYAAFSKGILPVAGQSSARFYPDWPLLRGEAAAYIFNALQVQLYEEREQAQEDAESDEQQAGQSSSSQQAVSIPSILDVGFPFSTSGKFDGRKPFSYRFNMTSSAVVSTKAALQSGQTGKISCRLYLLQEDGFSLQYYLGYQEGGKCYLRTALTPGLYQLQLQPTSFDATFTVKTEETTGDGNDGFSEADAIAKGITRTEVLSANDLQDWYRFTVDEEQNMTVGLSNSAELRCIVYAMEDVDLYGFSGPQCNQVYSYPPGTYYISVGRKSQKAATKTYTVQLR